MRVVGENYALCGFLASGRQVEKEPEPVCKWCAKKAVKEVKGG